MTQKVKSFLPLLQVLVLWLAGLGAAAQFAKISVAFPYIRALYPDAGAELGLLLSLIGFFGIVFGLTAGVLVARLGFRRMLLIALILGAVVSFWQARLPGFGSMLTSRLLEGVSHLIIVVAAPTLIAQLSPPRYLGLAMTLWSTFFGVAFVIVAWFGLPLVASYGLAQLFWVHGFFMLGVALAIGLFIKKLPLPPPPPLRFKMVVRQHIQAYRSPYISAPAIGWFFYTLTFVSLLSVLPEFLPAKDRSMMVSLLPLASIAVALLGVALLLRYFSAVSIVILGFVLASLTVALSGSALSVSYVFLTLFAVLGLVQGGSFAAVPQLNVNAREQAEANGAMAQMGNLGNTLGTPILLLVVGGYGLTGLMITVLACYSAGIVAHLWLARIRAGAG